jgi:nitroreductase
MEFNQVVTLRQSVRAFQPQQVSEAQLNAVLQAAYHAPVAMGQTENIHLTVVQNPQVLDQLNEIFAETVGNPEAKPTYGAPTVIFVSGPKENEDILNGANAAVIVENMLLAAADQGLGGVYLFGISQATQGRPEPAQLLNLPQGFRTISAIAMGYPVETPQPRDLGVRYETNYVK